jgi:uncharacterized protein YecT (DUF1311 family)
MKKILCSVLVLGVLVFAPFSTESAVAAVAEEESTHPIDAEYERRVEADPSTSGMIDASVWAAKEWDKLLNKNYQELMKNLSEGEQSKLKASQRKWIEYRDLEFAFNAGYWGKFQGTMYSVIPYDYQAEFVKTRALELGAYLENSEEE